MCARSEFLLPLVLGPLNWIGRFLIDPRWRLRWVLWAVRARTWDAVWLRSFAFRAASERFRSARLGELWIVRAGTRWVLAQIGGLLDVSHRVREGVTLGLVRFQELPLVTIDVIVVGWPRSDELLLSLVGRSVLLSTRAPGRDLGAIASAVPRLHRVMELVVAWARSIDFLRLKVRLGAQGRLETAAICLSPRWITLFIESRSELVAWSADFERAVVHTGSGAVRDLLHESGRARAWLLVRVWPNLYFETRARIRQC